jgi:hypothetical protein
MKVARTLFSIGTIICCATGCASTNDDSSTKSPFAQWANSASCNYRIVIVPPHSSPSEVQEIANKYDAPTFSQPSHGFIVDAMTGGLSHTLGNADPKSWGLVRGLAENLEAINSTGKHWDVFVMSGASYLFSQTLKAMSDDSLSAANGTIHLVGWQKTIEIENDISRISNGKFNVVYE